MLRTDRPLVFIKVYPGATKGNKDLGTALDVSERLLSFRYEDETDRADRCDLVLDNHDMSQFDNPAWKKGHVLDVAWGYPGNMTATRRVVIQKMRGSTELRIEAHGLVMLMHKVKVRRAWAGKTLHSIVTDVVKGYEGQIGDMQTLTRGISDDSKNLTLSVHQSSETDAMFLLRLARKYGFQFYLDQTGFHFYRRDNKLKQVPAKTLKWFNGNGEWLEFNYETDVTEKHSRIGASSINPFSKKKETTEASNDETKREGLAANVVEWKFREGAVALADVLKDIKDEVKSLPSSVQGPVDEVAAIMQKAGKEIAAAKTRTEEADHAPFAGGDKAAAKAHVDGKYNRRRPKEHQLSGKIVGDPMFLAKTVLMVEGIGRRLSGRWAVTKIEHSVDSNGYSSDFKAEREGDNGYGQTGDANSKANLNTKEPAKKDLEHEQPIHRWSPEKGQVSGVGTLDKRPFIGDPTAGGRTEFIVGDKKP